MELKSINRVLAILIILTNIYFVPLSFTIISNAGGPMGFGLLLIPILLSTNLLLITAGLSFKEKYKNSLYLLAINSLGLVWNLFWLWQLWSTPFID
jgi:hypothetical protein